MTDPFRNYDQWKTTPDDDDYYGEREAMRDKLARRRNCDDSEITGADIDEAFADEHEQWLAAQEDERDRRKDEGE
jgi:hypothetical protein